MNAKKTKTRKIIARVSAVVFSLILISLMILPTFAAVNYPQVIPPAPPEVNVSDVQYDTYLYLTGITSVQPVVNAFANVYGYELIIDYLALNGGSIIKSNVGVPIGSYADGKIIFTSVNYENYYVYMKAGTFETDPIILLADIDVEFLVYNETSNVSSNAIDCFVTFHSDGTGDVFAELEYEGYIYDDGDGNKFASFRLIRGFINLGSFNVSVLDYDVYIGYLGIPGISSSILDKLFYGYNSVPLNPYDVFTGMLEGAEKYNTDAWVDGWNAGFTEGYDYIDGEDLYQQGRNDAIKEIKDGDFGRNFLGAVFSAPLKALQDFNLVSWKTQNGNTISVSLGQVISAGLGITIFIWFLKLFSGG